MTEKTRSEEDLPHRDRADVAEIEREAAKARKQEEAIPPPGTDPLHEGP
jgi:hypothetical protein